jgi:hypothetical protein
LFGVSAGTNSVRPELVEPEATAGERPFSSGRHPSTGSGRTVLRPFAFFLSMPNPYQNRPSVGKPVGSRKFGGVENCHAGHGAVPRRRARATGHAGHAHQAERPRTVLSDRLDPALRRGTGTEGKEHPNHPRSCRALRLPARAGAQDRPGSRHMTKRRQRLAMRGKESVRRRRAAPRTVLSDRLDPALRRGTPHPFVSSEVETPGKAQAPSHPQALVIPAKGEARQGTR